MRQIKHNLTITVLVCRMMTYKRNPNSNVIRIVTKI